MDISDALNHFDPFDLEVTRFSAGAYGSDGLFVQGSTSVVTRSVVIVPATGKILEQLPEGLRTRQTLQVFSKDELLTGNEPNGIQADRFTHGGKVFEVQHVDDWNANGGFWRALATKVEAT